MIQPPIIITPPIIVRIWLKIYTICYRENTTIPFAWEMIIIDDWSTDNTKEMENI